jgi:preprotein translocase subunit SecG
MYQLILAVHVIIAALIVGLVLIQHGKGADIGASFGSGASNTVFGSRGTGSFLFKLTGGLALAFFLTSVSLSSLVARQYQHPEVIPQQSSVPEGKIPVPVETENK